MAGLLDWIGPGEVERSIPSSYDWTRDWNFAFQGVSQFRYSWGTEFTAYAYIFLNDLSGLGHEGIPWNDVSQTQRLEPYMFPRFVGEDPSGYKFIWKFCERSDRPRWGASIVIYSSDGSELSSTDNPWTFFDDTDFVKR